MRCYPRVRRTPGLTLIELVVVLVILVALAGILIPMLPSMLGRAHTSAGATNIGEINRSVQTYEQLYQNYPNDLDNLVETGGALVGYLPGGNVGGQLMPYDLTDSDVAALTNAGVTRLASLHKDKAALDANGKSPTFDPYDGGAQAVAKGLKVAKVDEAAVESSIVSDAAVNTTGDVYIVLGVGRRSSMTGKVMADAPTHFGENDATNAANVYSRFGLLFRLVRGGPTPSPVERAIFVGAVSFHETGISGADAHLEEYYGITKSQ